MRDDARSGVDELSRLYAKKTGLLRRLLLSESDKLHYAKSDNIERVAAIVSEDVLLIEEIDLIDCDIAECEEALARLAGVTRKVLYRLLKGSDDSRELLLRREEARDSLEGLLREREKLMVILKSATREVLESIEGIARIRGLKLPDAE